MNEYRDSDYVFATFRETRSHMVSQWECCRQEGIPYNDIMRRVPFNSWINYCFVHPVQTRVSDDTARQATTVKANC